VKLTDDVKQRKQKHLKQYRTAKQKLANKENLVRFLHRGKPFYLYYILMFPSRSLLQENFADIHFSNAMISDQSPSFNIFFLVNAPFSEKIINFLFMSIQIPFYDLPNGMCLIATLNYSKR